VNAGIPKISNLMMQRFRLIICSFDCELCILCQMLYQCNIEQMFVENIAKTIWVCIVCLLFSVNICINTLLEVSCENEQRCGNM